MNIAKALNKILEIVDKPKFLYMEPSRYILKCRILVNNLYFFISYDKTFTVEEEDKLGPHLYDHMINSALAKDLERKLNAQEVY